MVEFVFSENERESLILALGKNSSVTQSECFVLICQAIIQKNWLFIEQQSQLTAKETKVRLNDIGKTAKKLYVLLNKNSSKLPYQMLVSRETPELRKRSAVINIIRLLSEKSFEVAIKIKPRGRYRGDRRQLESWIDEAFESCFGKHPPKGSGTPLDHFKQTLWGILNPTS